MKRGSNLSVSRVPCDMASVRLVWATRVRVLWRMDIGGVHGVPYVGHESMAVVVDHILVE